MPVLLSCSALTKSYTSGPLFKNITFGIEDGERLGIIGPNGAGKSTLLALLRGRERPDAGAVSARKGLRIAAVEQTEEFPTDMTVGQVLRDALADSGMDEDHKVLRVDAALLDAGLTNADQAASALSGGWQKRLAIVRAIIREPDLLFMDEPTNHLDMRGLLWLESLLRNAPFAYAVVSHDRLFLERCASRIIELNPAYADGFLSVSGNYGEFLIKREEYLAAQAHLEVALKSQVTREIAWLQRGAQARTTKEQSRIQNAGRLIENLADVKNRNAQGKAAGIAFTASGRQTRDLVTAKGIAAVESNQTLFHGVNLTLAPKMRLGLLGPNGSGKTTLLRIITGERLPDSGTVKRADGLRIVTFHQDRNLLDQSMSLREALSPNGETVIYQGQSVHVSGWAKRFLFSPDQLQRPLSRFSGGEQARVLIARLMLEPADLLILDEPTNDLDIPTMEILQESLSDFPGALVLVTHDRYLLDQVSTEILALDGAGDVRFFADYPQWESNQALPIPSLKAVPASSPNKAPAPEQRMTTAERREWKGIEDRVHQAEQRVDSLKRELEDPAVASDPVRLPACWQELQAAEGDVLLAYARWEELEAKQSA